VRGQACGAAVHSAATEQPGSLPPPIARIHAMLGGPPGELAGVECVVPAMAPGPRLMHSRPSTVHGDWGIALIVQKAVMT